MNKKFKEMSYFQQKQEILLYQLNQTQQAILKKLELNENNNDATFNQSAKVQDVYSSSLSPNPSQKRLGDLGAAR